MKKLVNTWIFKSRQPHTVLCHCDIGDADPDDDDADADDDVDKEEGVRKVKASRPRSIYPIFTLVTRIRPFFAPT